MLVWLQPDGGPQVGEKLFYMGPGKVFEDGDKLVYGAEGEVVGLAAQQRKPSLVLSVGLTC